MFLAAFAAVCLVATGLRFYRLPELPVGLHYDEAANGILAGEIARGLNAPVFISAYTGKEVLFFYWAALWMRFLGVTLLALRLGAALIGVATVIATVWMAYELLHEETEGRWIALGAGGLLAVSFWHLVLSRYGFRAVGQPLLQALTVAALWRGLRTENRKWLMGAGLFCGLTAYTYLAARAFPIPLAGALVAFLVADRGRRRKRLAQLAIFIGMASLALAPLAWYWLTHPGSFMVRTEQVAADSWSEVWRGLVACLNMFFVEGDPYIRFNLPHRPLFQPGVAGLLMLGIGFGVRQVTCLGRTPDRRSASLTLASYTFLLLSIPVMILPSALATDEITPSNLRTVGLLPFVYVFPALGLFVLKSVLRRGVERLTGVGIGGMAGQGLAMGLVILVLVLGTPATAGAYFREWASSAALYNAADGDMVHVADYLNEVDSGSTALYVASQHYRHPTVAFLAEDYDRVQWLVDGQTLVFPSNEDALFVFPRSASKGLAWVASVLPDDALVAAPSGPDQSPDFHAYRVCGEGYPMPERSVRANFSDTVELLGYTAAAHPRSGGDVEVAVWWKVVGDAARQDYRPILRLADRWDFVWGESQPFHFPSEQWVPDRVVVDHFVLPMTPGAPPGEYHVRFGFYSPGGDVRLPVLDEDGAYGGTYVELPVTLDRAETPPRVEDLSIGNPLDVDIGGLILLGNTMEATRIRPGERLYLTLFWQANEAPLASRPISLWLGDAKLYDGDPVCGTYPFGEWSPGEIVSDRYGPRIPLDMPPGDYRMEVRVADAAVDLGRLTVQQTDRVFDVPLMSYSVKARLGNRVELLGYDLSTDTVAPGETFVLTLYWRALVEMRTDYTVFTHLLAPDGSMTGQRDNPPVDGTYPTSLWVPGEVVRDVYEIPVHVEASAGGEHQLEVGMYVPATGMRLSVEGSGDNAVSLQTITVSD
jgi:4-amino-4-deoxy-L-arabinose transferase-like glycosyltransferase